MKENVLVSVIVPTYNVEKYAAQCFDSIINQTMGSIEIILVDDGSTDLSGSICDEYKKKDSRVKVIHQANIGLGLSRNSGIRIAQGEYIGFVDSDDCISPNMFEILYKNAKKNDADISYCKIKKFTDGRAINNHDTDLTDQEIKIWKSNTEIKKYLLDRIGLEPENKNDKLYGASVCCGIFSRRFIQHNNLKFISEREYISEDIIFDIDAITKCNTIVHSNLQLYFYRFNPKSLTTTYKADRFEKNVILYHEMHRRLKFYYSDNEIFNSLSRYLLVAARLAVIQEARFCRMNGLHKACSNVEKVCNTVELKETLAFYQYTKLPLKYRIIANFQKRKMCRLLLLTCIMYVRFKRNI